jgi:Uma2 family endonuclease
MSSWAPSLARPEPLGRRLSLDDWLALPDELSGELVDGRLREEEMPDPIHELAVTWLIALFRAWLGGQGFVFGSELRLAISPEVGRKPDIVVIFPGEPRPPRRGALRTPPTLVVEVVSPSPSDERRDRVEKMAEYAAFGIRFYWLVDPALGSLEIFELLPSSGSSGGRFVKLEGRTSGTFAAAGCEGLTIDLDALWAELDRLGDEDDVAP